MARKLLPDALWAVIQPLLPPPRRPARRAAAPGSVTDKP